MEIHKRLDQQDAVLKEILFCLKGSEALNIEGVIPAQKRMGNQISTMELSFKTQVLKLESDVEDQLKEMKVWKEMIQNYFNVIFSRGFKIFSIFILICFIGMWIYLKYGVAWLAKVVLKIFF